MAFWQRYKLSDGQTRNEKGVLRNVGQSKVFAVTGSYSYVGPDGRTYRVEYTADEKGYRAKVDYNAQNVPNFVQKVEKPKNRIPIPVRKDFVETKTTQRPQSDPPKYTSNEI